MGDSMTDKFPEIYAARILETVLGVEVIDHDDGTRDAMPDLIIRTDDGDRFVEVVSDVDAGELRMQARMVKAVEWLARAPLPHPGTWSVCLAPDAEVHTVRSALRGLIARAPVEVAAAGKSLEQSFLLEGAAAAGILSMQRVDVEPPEGARHLGRRGRLIRRCDPHPPGGRRAAGRVHLPDLCLAGADHRRRWGVGGRHDHADGRARPRPGIR